MRALVVHAHALGRNVMRSALERIGASCEAVATVPEAEARLGRQAYDVVSIDADQPGDAALNLIRRLRRSRFAGTLLHTAELVPDGRLHELTRELGVRAVFLEPLTLAEVEIRLLRIVPGARAGARDPDAGVPPTWNGALREARKRYGKNLPVWSRELLAQVAEARRTRDPRHATVAADTARRVAKESAQHAFVVIAEVTDAIAGILDDVAAGRRSSASSTPWDQVDALLELFEAALPDASRSVPTVNTASMEQSRARLLVVSQDLDALHALARLAERHEVGLLTARDVREAVRVSTRRPVDAALIAADLPDRGASVLAEWLRRQPGQQDLPLALLVDEDEAEDPGRLAQARTLAARFLLPLPVEAHRFGKAIQRLTRQHPRRRPTVLLLDDDPARAQRLRPLLAAHGVELERREEPRAALARLDTLHPDLFVLDTLLPVVSGFDVCRQLRGTPAWTSVPVLFLASDEGPAVRQACFRAGGDDCLVDPDDDELIARIVGLLHRFRGVRDQDPLTGCLRRAAFVETLRTMLDGGDEVAVAVLDVDWFGEINRQFGYGIGDHVLAEVAGALAQSLGEDVPLARWGDDQFAVALSGESRRTATVRVEQAAAKVRALQFEVRGPGVFGVSVQAGVTATSRGTRDAELLLREADAGLTTAKQARAG